MTYSLCCHSFFVKKKAPSYPVYERNVPHETYYNTIRHILKEFLSFKQKY